MQGSTEAQRGELEIWGYFFSRSICWLERKELRGWTVLLTAWGEGESGTGTHSSPGGNRDSRWTCPILYWQRATSLGKRWPGIKQILVMTITRPQIFHFWNCIEIKRGFADGSDGKESVCNAGDGVLSLGRKDSLEKRLATHSHVLAWRIPRTEEPRGLQSMGLQRVRHYGVTYTFTTEIKKDLSILP